MPCSVSSFHYLVYGQSLAKRMADSDIFAHCLDVPT